MQVIIEPFAGSLAFSLNSGRPFAAWDTSAELIAMWQWLKKVEPDELKTLTQYQGLNKVDVRTLPICVEAKTYLRINIASVMTGQLSSWSIYPQHKLPVEQTIEALPAIRTGTYTHGSAASILAFADKADQRTMVFLDPPYLGTKGNYADMNEGDLKAIQATKDIIATFKNSPITLTYGDGAEETFPGLPWETVLIKKVPNLRKGGTVERREMAAFIGVW